MRGIKKTTAAILAVVMIVAMLPKITIPVLAEDDPYYEEFGVTYEQLFTLYPKYLRPAQETPVVNSLMNAYKAALGEYSGVHDFLPSFIYALDQGGMDILSSEILAKFGIGKSTEEKLIAETSEALMREILKTESELASVTSEISGNFKSLKSTYDIATAAGKLQFIIDLKSSCKNLSDSEIDKMADSLFKEESKLMSKVDKGIEFWQLIVGMVQLQELQEESICQLRDAMEDNSDFAKALDDLLAEIKKDPSAYMLEYYCTDIVLDMLSKAIQKSAFALGKIDPSKLTVAVANIVISIVTSVYPGAMADEIYQTTLLSSYVSEFGAAIDAHRTQFFLAKVEEELIGQDDIAEYEYLYSSYITTIRETLKSALDTAKTDGQRGNIQNAIALCNTFTYDTYIQWCMAAVKADIDAGIVLPPEECVYKAGTCGENLTWELNYSRQLTISGTGDMTDFADGAVPWEQERNLIETVEIKDGVTSIGYWAFALCDNLTSVTIPNSVTVIGEDAFCLCRSLCGVIIPDSVTHIEDHAFINCHGLTSVNIPDSVTSLGAAAFAECMGLASVTIGSGVTDLVGTFWNCGNLKSVTIPASVTSIREGAFDNCNSYFLVDKDNPNYACDDQGVLYNKNKTSLIYASWCINSCMTIPASVTSIGECAFSSNKNLTSVIIPPNVTSIGMQAFSDCANLTSVVIEGSDTQIGVLAFSQCESLTHVTIPRTVLHSPSIFDFCSLSTVVYKGTPAQWDVSNMKDWDAFSNAQVICIGDLKFSGASLSLQNNLAINYKVDKTYFEEEGYIDPYVVFELNGVKTIVSDYTVNSDHYVFTFRNIAPNQMNDTIKATLYATYDGAEYTSAIREYSVGEYCYSMLDLYASDEYAELRTLLVDLLHYGAASQTYTGYRADALVNASLTEAQLAWGTNADPAMETVLDTDYQTVDAPAATWIGAGLTLQDSVTVRVKFTAESKENLSVKIESGSNTWTVTSGAIEEKDGVYYVYFRGLHAGQMRQNIYLTVCEGEIAVSNTVCYSIGSYAYEMQDSAETGLGELLKAMMKYGDSAGAYAG